MLLLPFVCVMLYVGSRQAKSTEMSMLQDQRARLAQSKRTAAALKARIEETKTPKFVKEWAESQRFVDGNKNPFIVEFSSSPLPTW